MFRITVSPANVFSDALQEAGMGYSTYRTWCYPEHWANDPTHGALTGRRSQHVVVLRRSTQFPNLLLLNFFTGLAGLVAWLIGRLGTYLRSILDMHVRGSKDPCA